ncbi:glucan endo-1,3-beta-glucosidase 13 isoform X2 [Magnolia sinica]|uniref:glucan endo-1,3-beta-glucosidase 13 isoform X2 n=1 Tax=Magnolia sinica TaxID=86752 RepID=UPI00265837C5|nr:glucan endo-1,3-beta-glucosidase 13 isoform X2 [Magnolia sinica]
MMVNPASAMEVVQEKVESTVPITTLSPPEGNTTFLEGTTWCVAHPGVLQDDLQNALDWACGLGMADCSPIQKNGVCFEPDTLLSHASFAFNNYYQQNGDSDIACNFGGTATLTTKNPSYGSCVYPTSGPAPSSSPPLSNLRLVWWEFFGILLLLYLFK